MTNDSRRQGRGLGRPVGRPPLRRDFVTICDALLARRGEPGLITHVAAEFQVSRAWLYKRVLPLVDRERQ